MTNTPTPADPEVTQADRDAAADARAALSASPAQDGEGHRG